MVQNLYPKNKKKNEKETIKGVAPGKYDSGAFQYCYDSKFVKSADKLGQVNVVNGDTPGASSLIYQAEKLGQDMKSIIQKQKFLCHQSMLVRIVQVM